MVIFFSLSNYPKLIVTKKLRLPSLKSSAIRFDLLYFSYSHPTSGQIVRFRANTDEGGPSPPSREPWSWSKIRMRKRMRHTFKQKPLGNEFWQSSKVWFPALKAFSWFWLLDPSKSRGIKNFVGNHHMTSSRFESKTWIGKTWTILRKNEKIIFGKIAKPRFYLLTVKFRFSKMSHFNSHIIMKSWDSRISLSWLRLHLKQFSALGGTKQQSTNKCLIMFTEHVLVEKPNHQSEER